MSREVLAPAFKKLGSQAGLARAIGVTPQAITKWINDGIPAERVLDIERACSGAVSRHDLRPDIYPRERVRARRVATQ